MSEISRPLSLAVAPSAKSSGSVEPTTFSTLIFRGPRNNNIRATSSVEKIERCDVQVLPAGSNEKEGLPHSVLFPDRVNNLEVISPAIVVTFSTGHRYISFKDPIQLNFGENLQPRFWFGVCIHPHGGRKDSIEFQGTGLDNLKSLPAFTWREPIGIQHETRFFSAEKLSCSLSRSIISDREFFFQRKSSVSFKAPQGEAVSRRTTSEKGRGIKKVLALQTLITLDSIEVGMPVCFESKFQLVNLIGSGPVVTNGSSLIFPETRPMNAEWHENEALRPILFSQIIGKTMWSRMLEALKGKFEAEVFPKEIDREQALRNLCKRRKITL